MRCCLSFLLLVDSQLFSFDLKIRFLHAVLTQVVNRIHLQEMKQQGASEDKLQLLKGIYGAFRPGVLTALVGVSGAGKTTLMDVLAGRKTGGYIEGDIHIAGFPKVQETFARISGYVEQNDIHSPLLTVSESLTFSAWLRLHKSVDDTTKAVRLLIGPSFLN